MCYLKLRVCALRPGETQLQVSGERAATPSTDLIDAIRPGGWLII